MSSKTERIGLIAGGGRFPFLIAQSAKKRGLSVFAIAHEGETDPALENSADQIEWIKLGKFGQLLKVLKKSGVKRAVMAGTIKKRRMFDGLKPDLKGLMLMSKLALFHDDGILRAVADEIEKNGVKIISCASLMPELLAPGGCLTERKPTKDEMQDVEAGWRIAKEIGRLDIGQCIVMKNRTVIAVEAMEGTDETIRRAGRITGGGGVVIKVSKPDQDLRFDIPTVGINTLKVMKEARASLLVIEKGKTLMFDREEMIGFANGEGISILSME